MGKEDYETTMRKGKGMALFMGWKLLDRASYCVDGLVGRRLTSLWLRYVG